MSATTVTNTTPQRKQLSDQLDRLDLILDGLSDGLNGAVVDAAREGTRLALKDAIVEIMTDPTLRSRLREATAPEEAVTTQPPKPGFWARMKSKVSQAAASVGRAATRVVDGTMRIVQMLADVTVKAYFAVKEFGRLKTLTLIGLGAGMAAGVTRFLAPKALSAAAVRVRNWSRRACRALSTI